MTNLRVPPSCPQSERALLAAILIQDDLISTITDIVTPDDFYTLANRSIYQAMLAIHEQKKRIDTFTLIDELKARNVLNNTGGEEYIIELQSDIPSLNNVEQYAVNIRGKSQLRKLIIASTEVITSCSSTSEIPIDELIGNAEQSIFAITHQQVTGSFKQLNIFITKAFKDLTEISKGKVKASGIMSNFRDLDTLTNGFQQSDLIIVAARPSMGKTALALNMGLNAILNGYNVGMFSLEMPGQQLVFRMLATLSGVSQTRIRNANITSDEWMQLTEASALLSDKKMFINDTPALSITALRANARHLKQQYGLDLLIIDYLQLITTTKWFENRNQEITSISANLKALAKELNIPVIALSQLSRAVDKRTDNRPILSDLRDSGAIEQDADIIAFLYRDELYNNETLEPDTAELIVSKHRNGPIGTIKLKFNKELTKFENE
jgi:replicative DNA helicase